MFNLKTKEPALSEDMELILNRSTGDDTDSLKIDDIVRCKYKIMKLLTEDVDILNTLHNVDLGAIKPLNGDAYRNVNIFDFMKLPSNKDIVNNYICFEINDNGRGSMTNKTIIFRCVSHISDVETDWGVARHDLLAAIVKNKFDWSNVLGMRLVKQSDNGLVTDDGYYYREIIYYQNDPLNTYQSMNNRAHR